jgi:hypothetical protein
MLTNIMNWIKEVSYDIPTWGSILLIAFSLLFLYLLFIMIRNLVNIILMPTTPIIKLKADKVVEIKGVLKGRKELFKSPFDDKKLAFLNVEVGFSYEDNVNELEAREKILGRYQKGDELFDVKDKTGTILVAHHTFLNKAFLRKELKGTSDKAPKGLLEMFPEIRQHFIDHKQEFFFRYSYLEQDQEVMVTGRVVRGSINKEDGLIIYGGVGSLKQWQKDMMPSENRDFHSERQDEIQLYTNLEMKGSDANQFNINFGSEGDIITKKLFQVILAFILIGTFSIFSFMVGYCKILV